VEILSTHISHIFLVGDRAYKLKHAVAFPYLDFSTVNKRRLACEAEVRLNRRTAPGLYLDVVPVSRPPDGDFLFNDDRDPVDWLVEMRRFSQNELFDSLARENRLSRPVMEKLAEQIFSFHDGEAPVADLDGAGIIRLIINNNVQCLVEFSRGVLDQTLVDNVVRETDQLFDLCVSKLSDRSNAGKVRHCHGDLHLKNIVLLEGLPTLFDAIEFNTALSEIDTFYDLAFLLMDLAHRGLPELANTVFNRYLELSEDYDALACLPLFQSMRAVIRGHVAAAQYHQTDERERSAKQQEAADYLKRALTFRSRNPARLIGIGGLSGTGKSRLARDLAPRVWASPGAVILRSDVTRKRLAGAHPLDRLPPEAYSWEMTQRTFETLNTEAKTVLSQGHTVIVDAVFSNDDQRNALENVAREAGTPFTGLWLTAAQEVREERVAERTGDASDATVEIVRQQAGYDVGTVGWHKIEAASDREITTRLALDYLEA